MDEGRSVPWIVRPRHVVAIDSATAHDAGMSATIDHSPQLHRDPVMAAAKRESAEICRLALKHPRCKSMLAW
jgi:hypothetical protein